MLRRCFRRLRHYARPRFFVSYSQLQQRYSQGVSDMGISREFIRKSPTRTCDHRVSALCLFGVHSFFICSFPVIAWIWYNREDQRPRNNTMLLHIAFGGRSISTLYSFWDENVLIGFFFSPLAFSRKDFFRWVTERRWPLSLRLWRLCCRVGVWVISCGVSCVCKLDGLGRVGRVSRKGR